MPTALEAVAALEDVRSRRPEVKTTGFATMDEVTGGFALGQVWILTGTPGQGRSMLAGQWALSLASRHGWDTQLVSRREPNHLVAARLVAGAGPVLTQRVWNQDLDEWDQPRVDHAREVLGGAKLLLHGPDDLSLLSTEVPGDELPDVFVVDDADLAPGVFPQRIASLAARGVLIILTFPRHLVLARESLDPEWARVADFVIDIRRPDLMDPDSTRPGEADLDLLRNRWGPARLVSVGFQGHYSRFVELTA